MLQDLTFFHPRFLDETLCSPQFLSAFEAYLEKNYCHENLLFIEALARLGCEQNLANIERAVDRIWNTFVTVGAPLEINITCRGAVKKAYDASRYTLLNTKKALKIFEQAEIEVTEILESKMADFKHCAEMTQFSLHYPKKSQKKVAIIGGGFVGFTVASILDPMPRFHVTLIDAKDSFEYTPGMIKMLVRPEETTSSLRVRHDAYVKNGRVVIGIADRIGNDATVVHVNKESIPFDYLVIATGSTYQSKLKSFDISALYRMSDLGVEYHDLKMASNILVIGGGLVGCELASEIALHEFPDGHPKRKAVTLVESHSTLVRRSSPERQQKALNYLRSIGVNVICGEKIVDFNSSGSNVFLGSSCRSYRNFDKVYLATGTTPCSQILKQTADVVAKGGDSDQSTANLESCVDNWDRICVKPTLQLKHWKYQHIFAGGDVTNVKEEKTGYAATLAGVCIARNICRMEKGKQPLDQGAGGTLPAPMSPLHGREDQGGIGRDELSVWKKSFSFLHSGWARLKYFDEQQFLQIVAGEANATKKPIGRLPRRLENGNQQQHIYQHHHHEQQDGTRAGSKSATNLTGPGVLSSAQISMEDHNNTATTAASQVTTASTLSSKTPITDHSQCSPSPSVHTCESHLSLEDIYSRSISELQAIKFHNHDGSKGKLGDDVPKGHHRLVSTDQHPWEYNPFGSASAT